MKRIRKKARKITYFLWLLLISLCILVGSSISDASRVSVVGQAEELQTEETKETAEELLDENVREQLEKLDLSALEEYLETLDGFQDTDVKDRLLAYIQGAEIDYENFAKDLLKIFLSDVGELIPAFACIAAISLISGLISMMKSNATGKTSTEVIFLVTYAASLIPLIAILTECFTASIRCVSEMSKQMHIIFPLMLTLLSASGGAVSAAVCRPAVGFFATTIVSVIQSVIFPLTILIIAFSMASNLTKELKINKFTQFFKSINKWIIGVCISVFGLFFTLQGITAASYDGVVRRAAKYAIGNGIPIVGGFLSGGFDLAVAGSVLIKNSLGSMGIFLMLSTLFQPLILLVSVNILLRLVAAVTQPFGDSRISDFLGETADNLHFCTAGVLFIAFLYFLSIVIMICCTEALF